MRQLEITKVIEGVRRSGVYAITHIETGKSYVGSAVDLRKRWITHLSQLRNDKHQNPHLQYAWNLFGQEAFEFSVLEYVDGQKELLIPREQFWMDKFKVVSCGYNLCAKAGSRLGKKQSEEAKRKISLAGKGLKRSAETRQRMSEAFKGRVMSEEARKKMSEARKARSKDSLERHAATLRGRRISPESIAKREATRKINLIALIEQVSYPLSGDLL